MVKQLVYIVAAFVFLILFALLVYPTPYRYHVVTSNGSSTPIKENWITGKTYMFNYHEGWLEMPLKG